MYTASRLLPVQPVYFIGTHWETHSDQVRARPDHLYPSVCSHNDGNALQAAPWPQWPFADYFSCHWLPHEPCCSRPTLSLVCLCPTAQESCLLTKPCCQGASALGGRTARCLAHPASQPPASARPRQGSCVCCQLRGEAVSGFTRSPQNISQGWEGRSYPGWGQQHRFGPCKGPGRCPEQGTYTREAQETSREATGPAVWQGSSCVPLAQRGRISPRTQAKQLLSQLRHCSRTARPT